MKLKVTFFALAAAAFTGLSAQITITQSNFPFVQRAVYQPSSTALVPVYSTGANTFIDLGSLTTVGNLRGITYEQLSNHSVFTTATERNEGWINLGPVPMKQQVYYQKNAQGYHALGIGYTFQKMGLGHISGNNSDSITFPAQTNVFAQPYTEIKFPLTGNTQWMATSIARTHFLLDLFFLGFNQTPCYFDSHFTTSHSVVGYGTARVPAKGNPSATMDILLLQTEVVRIDSFYINGQPADPFLLASMGLNQGDTLRTYTHRLLRENGGMQELALIDYDDDTYTNVWNVEYSGEFDVLSVKHAARESGISVYPNPVPATGFFVEAANALNNPVFTITDNTGRQLQATATAAANGYHIAFSQTVAPGIYYLSITTDTKTATERLLVK